MELQSINPVVFWHIPRSDGPLIKIAHIPAKHAEARQGIQLPNMSESVPLMRKRHSP
jgi:hypothetical protein